MKETFEKIFEQSDIVLFDTPIYRSETINISIPDIETELIQTAGRWCERYASDLFIEWESMQKSLKKHIKNKNAVKSEIFIFGFRHNGVDHDAYVMFNMKNPNCHISEYYSKIYAVKIQDIMHDSGDKTIQITMNDILNNVMFYNINQ